MTFSLNYTFWLDLIFGAMALYLFWLNRRPSMDHHGHGLHDHHGHGVQGVAAGA